MNSLVNECVKSINAIDTTDFNGEIAVCESLLETYERAALILECYKGDDLSPFSCFTESAISVVQEADDGEKLWEFEARKDKKDGTGKENILWSIIAFIPRLIAAVVKFIYRGLKQIFTGKKATEAMDKQIVDEVKKTKREIREDKAKDAYAELVESIYGGEQAGRMLGADGAMSDGDTSVNIFQFALNEELFDPAAFSKGSTATDTDHVFYIYPPINLDELLGVLRRYEAEFARACGVTIKTIVENDKIGEKMIEAELQPIAAAGASLRQVITNYTTTSKTMSNMQKRTKKAIVSANGMDTAKNKLTPPEYYTFCDNLSKIADVIKQDADILTDAIAAFRASGKSTTPRTEAYISSIVSSSRDIATAVTQVTEPIFSIGKIYPKMLGRTANSWRSTLHKFTKSDDEFADLRGEKQFESAVEDLGDSFYQNENIEAVAY